MTAKDFPTKISPQVIKHLKIGEYRREKKRRMIMSVVDLIASFLHQLCVQDVCMSM